MAQARSELKFHANAGKAAFGVEWKINNEGNCKKSLLFSICCFHCLAESSRQQQQEQQQQQADTEKSFME